MRDRNNSLIFRKIANRYEISIMSAKQIYDRYKKISTVHNLPYNKMIISARTVKENLNLINVHQRIVRRRLNERDFKNYIAMKKPFINNQVKRLGFALQYINKPLSFWSNESKFINIKRKKKIMV